MTWVETEGVLLVSTTTAPALRDLLNLVAPGARTPLSGLELRRLVEAANLERFFSIGKRAMQAGDTSYVTSAGRKAEEGITPSDARVFDLGHAMGRSGDGLFGFSVQKSKIWEPGAADSLFGFRSWCEEIARGACQHATGPAARQAGSVVHLRPVVGVPGEPPRSRRLRQSCTWGAALVADGEIVMPELIEFEPRRDASTPQEAVFDVQIRGESRDWPASQPRAK